MTNVTSRRTRTTLILGASHGIDLKAVKQYRVGGQRAIAIARMQETAHALQALGAETHMLDSTDANAATGPAQRLDDEALDAAIYVAGTYGPRTQGVASVSQADFNTVMHANVWAPMGVLPAVLPMMETGCNSADKPGGVPAVISSRMDSTDDMMGNGGWLYRVSKAAVSVVLRKVSTDVKNVTCLTFHPGRVQTNMGGTDVAVMPQGNVAGVRRTITGTTCADNGGFHGYNGSVTEW